MQTLAVLGAATLILASVASGRVIGTVRVMERTFDVIGGEAQIQISFDQLSQVDVSGFCHYANGHYAMIDGRLVINDLQANVIGCGPLEDDSEWWFARLLSDSPMLIWSGEDVVLWRPYAHVTLRPHSALAGWGPDPAYPIQPGDRLVHLKVTEYACASAKTPEGRILPPTIEYRSDSISISIRIRTLTSANCPSNGPYPYVVYLNQPVGHRTLIDANATGVLPPS